jgi:hypothetical protein
MLPTGDRKWQLIYPNCYILKFFGYFLKSENDRKMQNNIDFILKGKLLLKFKVSPICFWR